MDRRSAMGWCALALATPAIQACTTYPRETHTAAQRVFIIHGYGASPSSHWFPWLKSKVESRGAQAIVVQLPNPESPDFNQWQAALQTAIGAPRSDDVFVAHSLGTISLLHYLSAHTTQTSRIGGIVLVSGFGERLPNLPRIDDYDVDAYVDQTRIDFSRLSHIAQPITLIISDNDAIVAPEESLKLAKRLNGRVIRIPEGGHFLAEEGFTELQPARQAVEPLIKSQRGRHS